MRMGRRPALDRLYRDQELLLLTAVGAETVIRLIRLRLIFDR